MQTDKYYTPDISEFYVGFEYEIFEDFDYYPEPLWNKQIYGVNGINPEQMDFVEKETLKKIRVKYLDSKDLEELGWIIDFINDNIIYCRFIENAYYFLTLGLNSTVIVSYKDEILFDGKIKNKSELKKLMQQLGILWKEQKKSI